MVQGFVSSIVGVNVLNFDHAIRRAIHNNQKIWNSNAFLFTSQISNCFLSFNFKNQTAAFYFVIDIYYIETFEFRDFQISFCVTVSNANQLSFHGEFKMLRVYTVILHIYISYIHTYIHKITHELKYTNIKFSRCFILQYTT